MLESSNSDINELHSTNQDLRTYIYNIKKESEAYPEQNTLHFENVANVAVNSDGTTTHKNKNGIKEYCQENCHISLE